MSSHWPTAAAACLRLSSVGRVAMCSLPQPQPMAPEETNITSLPALRTSESTRASRSIFLKFIPPPGWVSVEVPTLTTMREAMKNQTLFLVNFLTVIFP